MRIFALIFSFLICFTTLNAQSLDSLKHIVVVTELQDSMALINNNDINTINKVFYERAIFDSLNTINDSIINNLNLIKIEQSKIIMRQKVIIQNDSLIKLHYQNTIDDKNKIIIDTQKDIKNQKTQKTIWQSTSGVLAIVVIILLCI